MELKNKLIENIPNTLTFIRIFSVPCIIATFYFNTALSCRIATIIFLLASMTDFLDGYIARKLNVQSNLGKMLDPLADKVIVICTLLMLVKHRNINEIPCILILCRELFVSSLREFLSLIKVKFPVKKLGKIKTTLQMISISFVLLGYKGSGIKMIEIVGHILLWICSIFTIFTGYIYLRASLNIIKNLQDLETKNSHKDTNKTNG